jgi:polysaccharide biosynthesis/export protein
MRTTAILLACLFAPLSACGADYRGLPPISSAGIGGDYTLGSGDEIRIAILGLDPASNTYVVSEAGGVSIPMLGNLMVAGKTTAEVERLIADRLRGSEIAPRASVAVQIQKYRPFYILGEVQKPGQYEFVPGLDVLKAVSLAGGYTFRADRRHPIVTRSTGSAATARALPTSPLRPGDTVVIPEAWF